MQSPGGQTGPGYFPAGQQIPLGTPAHHAAQAQHMVMGAMAQRQLEAAQRQLAASGYGAIAVSTTTGRTGWTWSYASQQEAEAGAKSRAGDPNAATYWGHHTYLALAQDAGGKYHWGWNNNGHVARATVLEAAGPGSRLVAFFHTDRGEIRSEKDILEKPPGYKGVVRRGVEMYLWASLGVLVFIGVLWVLVAAGNWWPIPLAVVMIASVLLVRRRRRRNRRR